MTTRATENHRTKTVSVCLSGSEMDTLREAVALARPRRSISLWIAEKVVAAMTSRGEMIRVRDYAARLPAVPTSRTHRASVMLAPKVLATLQSNDVGCPSLGLYQHNFLQALVIRESLAALEARAGSADAGRDERLATPELRSRIERMNKLRDAMTDPHAVVATRSRVIDKGWTETPSAKSQAFRALDVLERPARDPVLLIAGWLGLAPWVVFRALMQWALEDRAKAET